MSTGVLILGESGSGKSASLRNLVAAECALIQCIPKRLPFPKAKGWDKRTFVTDKAPQIVNAMRKAAAAGTKRIIVDDFQYLMANEFMRRASEKGYEKFTEIGHSAWSVLNAAHELPEDVRVYVLSHTEQTDAGRTKMKTIGKMLDDKVTLEGLFTIVLRAIVSDNTHHFATRNSGSDTVKAPMGLFEEEFIDNDLAAVDRRITDYYDIQPITAGADAGSPEDSNA